MVYFFPHFQVAKRQGNAMKFNFGRTTFKSFLACRAWRSATVPAHLQSWTANKKIPWDNWTVSSRVSNSTLNINDVFSIIVLL